MRNCESMIELNQRANQNLKTSPILVENDHFYLILAKRRAYSRIDLKTLSAMDAFPGFRDENTVMWLMSFFRHPDTCKVPEYGLRFSSFYEIRMPRKRHVHVDALADA